MTTYYVSNNGSDLNNGTSTSTPWKTVSKVNSAFLNGTINNGDSVLFKRGDTFYGALKPSLLSGSLKTLISAYGEGAKPIISGYKVLNNPSSWIQHSSNIWKIDLSDTSKYTGNIYTTDTNVGFLKMDGQIFGEKKLSLNQLVSPYQFFTPYYTSDKYLCVYTDGRNPTEIFSDIMACIKENLIQMRDNIEITHIDICGTGGHGIGGTFKNVTARYNTIREIGGSLQTPTVRYGNGFEPWSDSSDIIFEYNIVHDIYDAGYTLQGTASTTGYVNCHARKNVFWNCGLAPLELWDLSTTMTAGQGFIDCSFEDNICLHSAKGFGYETRPDKIPPSHIVFYLSDVPTHDISIKRNVFYNATTRYLYDKYMFSPWSISPGIIMDENAIFLESGQKISFIATETVDNPTSWTTREGKEQNSFFSIIDVVNPLVKRTIEELLTVQGLSAAHVTNLQDALNMVQYLDEPIIRNYNIDQSGIFQSSEIGTYTITCTDPLTGISSSTTVTVRPPIPTLNTELLSSITSLQSFATYNIGTSSTKKVGYLKFTSQYTETTDIVAFEYSTDQQSWTYNLINEIPNNKYCKINLYDDKKYYFRFSILRGTEYFYSETLSSDNFYSSPLFYNQQYIKLPNTNYFWLTCDLKNKYNIDDLKWQISQNQSSDWTDLNIDYTNDGQGTYRSKFLLSGRSGVWYYRLKISRLDDAFYSPTLQFNLDDMSPKNVIGWNPLLPKNPIQYLDSRIGFKVGAMKLGKSYVEPKSVLKLGLQKLGVYSLGHYVSIDIKLNTTVTTQRYYSNKTDANLIYELLQYYSSLSVVDIQYSLVKAEKVIKLINIINPEIELEVKQLQNIRIKSKTNPEISIESILNGEVELTSELDFEIEIETKI